jgi:hypothetical protein
MTLIADNGTLLSMEGHWTSGEQIVNTLFYHRYEVSPQEAADDVQNNWQDHIVPLFLNNYTYDGIRYLDINSADGVTGFMAHDPAKPFVGTGVDAGFPPALCVLMHKRIAGVRNARAGRLYMGPPQENQADENGLVLQSARDDYDDAFELFRSGTDDSGELQHKGFAAVLHVRPGQPVSWSRILSYGADEKLAVQRRRMGR